MGGIGKDHSWRRVLFKVMICPGIRWQCCDCTKNTGSYTLNWSVLWNVKYTTIKLLRKKTPFLSHSLFLHGLLVISCGEF